MRGTFIFPYFAAEFKSIHVGHQNITDDDVWNRLQGNLPSFQPIFGLQNVVRGRKVGFDKIPYICIVIHQKHDLLPGYD